MIRAAGVLVRHSLMRFRTALLVMAAAPADFRPLKPAGTKLKKDAAPEALALERTPDILRSTIADRPDGCVVVGFALETDRGLENARGKLESKELDLVVLNETGPASGFDVETNQVTLLDRGGETESLPVLSKDEVAERILDRVERRLPFPDE